MPGRPADRTRSLRPRLTLTVLLASGALAMLPAPAALAGACAPPGNSAVQQYLETLPGANCTTGSGSGTGALPSARPGGGHVTAAEASYLSHQGAAGQALLKLLAASPAPAIASSASPSHPTAAGLPAGGTPGVPGSETSGAPAAGEPVSFSPGSGAGLPAALLKPILSGSADVGGVGWLLPFGLAAVALGALANALRRLLWGPRADRQAATRSPNATKL